MVALCRSKAVTGCNMSQWLNLTGCLHLTLMHCDTTYNTSCCQTTMTPCAWILITTWHQMMEIYPCVMVWCPVPAIFHFCRDVAWQLDTGLKCLLKGVAVFRVSLRKRRDTTYLNLNNHMSIYNCFDFLNCSDKIVKKQDALCITYNIAAIQ